MSLHTHCKETDFDLRGLKLRESDDIKRKREEARRWMLEQNVTEFSRINRPAPKLVLVRRFPMKM